MNVLIPHLMTAIGMLTALISQAAMHVTVNWDMKEMEHFVKVNCLNEINALLFMYCLTNFRC